MLLALEYEWQSGYGSEWVPECPPQLTLPSGLLYELEYCLELA